MAGFGSNGSNGASAPVLRVRGLTKCFVLHGIGGRQVPALQGIDLDVGSGEFVALAGSSGAGKSSLLKCIYRTYRPSSGSVTLRTSSGAQAVLSELDDQAMADLREREIGYVSQFLRAEPRRGALDVVIRAGKRRGMDEYRAKAAAEDILRRLNVNSDLWSTYPTLLSGGEQQRVNLAASLLEPPRLLLLDEPVASLDAANRAAVFEAVSSLAGQGVAVLAVFHDTEAMQRLASRVVFMEHGQVMGQGTPAEMLA